VTVCAAGKINPWRAIAVFWGIVSSLSGTTVHFRGEGTRVLVRIH